MKYLILILQNIFRNKLRTSLTALGTMVLVLVVTLVWSVLSFLDKQTAEKSSNLKAIVSERWRLPSQMPYTYANTLKEGAARNPGDIRPDDSMCWSFFGGTLDPKSRSFESGLFAFAMEPEKLLTMMDDLDSLSDSDKASFTPIVQELQDNRRGIILGVDRLEKLNKRVGDRITIYSMNFKDINLEFDILGTFPLGRYDLSAAMNIDYLNSALDAYQVSHNGQKHPMAEKSLNLVWLRVPNQAAFTQMAGQILDSPEYSNPAVKMETASSGIAVFLEAYRDILWGMRYLLAPAILLTLSLVIANAISISVRERHKEFAVMKVLGFRPWHILMFVLVEAILIGALSGFLSAALTYYFVNIAIGGLKLPIAFFGTFFVPMSALWWGVAVGTGTAIIGSIVPAWTARTTRVSEVFSRMA